MWKRFNFLFRKRYSEFFKFSMMVASIIIIASVIPKTGAFKYEYKLGFPWQHATLIAPFDFAINKSTQNLKKEREKIQEEFVPIYSINENIEKQSKERFLEKFEEEWSLKYDLKNGNKSANLEFGKSFLNKIYKVGLIADYSEVLSNNKEAEIILLKKGNVAENKSFNSFYLLDSIPNLLKLDIENTFGLDNGLLINAISNSIQGNLVYEDELSIQNLENSLNKVSTAKGMVKEGEKIISKGEVVDSLKFLSLNSFKKEKQKLLGGNDNYYFVMIGQIILLALVIGVLMVFIGIFRKDIYADNSKMFLIFLIITSILIVLSIFLKQKPSNLYYIPYCIVPIIIRVLFDTRLALNIHIMVVILAGFFVPNGFEFVFLQTTAGMVSIYSIKNLYKRSQFLISASILLAYYIVAYYGLSLYHEGSLRAIKLSDIFPFVVSVVLTLLSTPIIFGLEKLFSITTEFSLVELSNTNNPLLKELSFKAPGTFQHSLQVANLAEAVIFQIGGDPLLVRAAALYHDVGKIDNPQYFIENQGRGINPHDELTYERSAQIIIKHVKRGAEIAKKNGVPKVIVDFILTHHGTTRVDYFYQNYIKSMQGKTLDENNFRYPGPVPFTKEQAVLMLADTVEAASRSIKEPTMEQIEKLINDVVQYKMDQNQLHNSDITLKDISIIKNVFKEMLMNIYHIRVEYSIDKYPIK